MLNICKEYRDEKILNIIEPIGYKQRVGNYYILRQDDGYININYSNVNKLYINFHKNFYKAKYPNNTYEKNFNNYKDFYIFLESYHKKHFRQLKLKKLNVNRKSI